MVCIIRGRCGKTVLRQGLTCPKSRPHLEAGRPRTLRRPSTQSGISPGIFDITGHLCSASSCTAKLNCSAARSHTPMAFLLLIPKGGRYPLVLISGRVANWWSPVELHKDPPVNLIKASGLKGLVSRDLFRSLIGPRTPQGCELVIQTHLQGKTHHERPELPVKQTLP